MKEYLLKLTRKETLTEKEAFIVFEQIVTDSNITDAQIGALLYAISASRLPIASEVIGAVRALRKNMIKVPAKEQFPNEIVIDTCGTGGSGLNTFNTSTACAFIAAAAGIKVAKHGNKAATSKTGSADLLKFLGIKTETTPDEDLECLRKTNFCFFYAPQHHPATKRVQSIRRELGFRTIFNFIGPLVNPAEVEYQLLGVSEQKIVPIIAEALNQLGTKHALVVCGDNGLDDISLTGETYVCEVKNGCVNDYTICPEDFGFNRVEFKKIEGDEPEKSAKKLLDIFQGKKIPLRDLVLLNSGAVMYISGKTKNIEDGIVKAADIIDSGLALSTLDFVIKFG